MNDTTSDAMPGEKRTVNQPRNRARPKTIDAATGQMVPAAAPSQRTPLKTLDNVKRELARVYRSVKEGKIASEEGTRRAFILNTLGRVMEAADLERRLDRLEKQQTKLLLGNVRPADGN